MLQDLILTAVNETIKKAEEVEHAEMAKSQVVWVVYQCMF